MPFQRTTLRGMCCQCFALKYSPKQIWEIYDHYVINQGEYPSPNNLNNVQEIEIIAPMLQYIGYFCLRNVYNTLGDMNLEECAHFYRCIHFGANNDMCQIYDHRPKMCKIYTWCEHRNTCKSWFCPSHPLNFAALQLRMDDLNLPLTKLKHVSQLLNRKNEKMRGN